MSEDQSLSNHQAYILNKFRKRLKKQIFLHNQASSYYAKQNRNFVIPGILITGISSVASFLATSDVLTDDNKQMFSIGVGVMTAGATILQSIGSSFGFQSRTESFQKAADLYDTLLTKIEFEIANPNEDFNEFCNNVEETILQIKNDCKYLPPLFIQKMWTDYKSSKHHDEEDEDDNLLTHIVINQNNNNNSNNGEHDTTNNNVDNNVDNNGELDNSDDNTVDNGDETTPLNTNSSINDTTSYHTINFTGDNLTTDISV